MNRRAKRLLEELDREVREHIELAMQENIDRGMSPEEARYAALRKFGNVTSVKENAREVWTVVWVEQFVQDLRFALRQLRKAPGFHPHSYDRAGANRAKSADWGSAGARS